MSSPDQPIEPYSLQHLERNGYRAAMRRYEKVHGHPAPNIPELTIWARDFREVVVPAPEDFEASA